VPSTSHLTNSEVMSYGGIEICILLSSKLPYPIVIASYVYLGLSLIIAVLLVETVITNIAYGKSWCTRLIKNKHTQPCVMLSGTFYHIYTVPI